MKKGLIKIITILSFFGGITTVNAAISNGSEVKKTSNKDITIDGLNYGNNSAMTIHDYRFSVDGKSVSGYCMDPAAQGATNLTVDRNLMDSSSASNVQSYDAAMMYMLKNGYSDKKTSATFTSSSVNGGAPFTLSGDELYAATQLAIRAYTIGLTNFGTNANTNFGQDAFAAYANLGAHWAGVYSQANPDQLNTVLSNTGTGAVQSCSDKSGAELTKCLQATQTGQYGNSYDPNITMTPTGGTSGEKVLYAAQALFRDALSAAENNVKTYGKKGDVSIKEVSSQKDGLASNDDLAVEYKIIEFTINNLGNNDYVKNVQVTCADCGNYGFTIGNLEYADGTPYGGENLAEKVGGSGTVQLRFKVEKDLNNDLCKNGGSAKYKITYDQSVTNAAPKDVAVVAKSSVQDKQRYIMLIEEDTTTVTDPDGNSTPESKEFESTIDCDESTQDPDPDPGNPDDPDKADPDPEEYDEPDPKNPCNSLMSSPVCDDSTNGNASGDKNGKILAIDPNGAEKSVKYCILDNKDMANNSYQLSESNGGIDNPYCRIFCKEDYDPIEMTDKIEDTRCGGYFQLKAHLTGRKECYTSGGDGKESKNDYAINRPKLDKVVAKYQTKSIAAYDAYQKNIELKKHMSTSNACTAGTGNYIITEGTLKTFAGGEQNNGVVPIVQGTEKIKASHPVPNDAMLQLYYYVSGYSQLSGKLLSATGNKENGGTIKMLGDGTSTTVSIPTTKNVSQFVPGRGWVNSQQTVNVDFQIEYMSEDAYNQLYAPMCVSEQEMETYINKEAIGKLVVNKIQVFEQEDKDNGLTQDELKERMEKYNGQKNSSIDMFNSCTVDSGEYTTWTMNFDTFNEDTPQIKWSYDDPYNDLLDESKRVMQVEPHITVMPETKIEVCFGDISDEGDCNGSSVSNIEDPSIMESVTYTACDENGCATNSSKEVSKAKFIKKSIEKSYSYTTPSVFYQADPLGKISVTEGNGPTVNTNLLEHLLPISLNATGLETFTLSIDQLGEYYSGGGVGRLIGGANSLASVIGNSGNNNFDGNYKCYVDTHCAPKNDDCPECTYDCTFDGTDEECEWVECPDCPTECINCIFTLEELQVNFKTVSTTNIDKNPGRTMGYNWDITTSLQDIDLSIIRDKAEATIDQIKDKNDTIFEGVDFDNKSKYENNNNTELSFSVKMTSDMIKDLQDYNKENEQFGGYGNSSLRCGDLDGYKNIACYSTVIDDLESKYADQIIAPHRGDANKYWQLWTDASPDNMGNSSVIGGPAWR